MFKLKRIPVSYVLLIIFLLTISILSRYLFDRMPDLFLEEDVQIFILGSILFMGYFINRIAPRTAIPSFVWAIFAGMAMQPLLGLYTSNLRGLALALEVIGAIILFSGGLEIPFRNFKKWFFPITSLSLIGVLISSMGFTVILYLLASSFGFFEPGLIPSLLVLGAALASTEGTAIIPTLKNIKLRHPFLKEIAISESALTDVSGSILTRFLLVAFLASSLTSSDRSIVSYFFPLFDKSSYDALGLQIITGIIVGYLGYVLIKKFYYTEAQDQEADPALLLTVPIYTFALGNVLGGAGFLAAFISGLFSDIEGGLKKVSHFYESLLNHLIEPFIFILLGALVPFSTLMALAPLGLVSALLFMFVLRPLVVFISLIPWMWDKTLTIQDSLFLSFIRETGIISAILLIISAQEDIINSEFAIGIGMWVILLTLVVEPPLTPYFIKRIGLLNENKKGRSPSRKKTPKSKLP
ncbi:hypothetical protein HGA91_03395 [candidate division WWE3 bacterium]|nr:hypothetical protein [candidate division WWE3 bacterium]